MVIMMLLNLLPTETVLFKIYERPTEPDDFGDVKPILVREDTVEGCLVSRPTEEDMMRGFELNHINNVVIHIPKTYTQSVRNCKAIIRGEEYMVILTPLSVTESPLQWNRSVVCEAVL